MSRAQIAVTAAVVAIAASVPSVAMAQTEASKSISAQLAAPTKGFVQPKTAWGEPDLQGVWTSDAALGIPRERPDKFGTRAMRPASQAGTRPPWSGRSAMPERFTRSF